MFISPAKATDQEVDSSTRNDSTSSPRAAHFLPEVGFFVPLSTSRSRKPGPAHMTRNTCHSPRAPFPDSVSGFTTEPSQSANVRAKSCGRPNHEAPAPREGRRVCSFLQIIRSRFARERGPASPNQNARCALGAFNGDVGRAFFNFPTWFANQRRPLTRGRKPRAAPSGLPRSQPAAKSRQGPSFILPPVSHRGRTPEKSSSAERPGTAAWRRFSNGGQANLVMAGS